MASVALSPAARAHDGFILDLDGCLWVGDEAVPGVPEAVQALRDAGKAIAFVTNDSGRAVEDYVRKLWRLGYQASVREVVTVGSGIQHLLADRTATAFVVGAKALVEHVAAAGLRVVNNTPFAARAEVVVVAGHEDLHFAELKVATQAVLRGAELIGATRDRTYPMPDGPWPGSGAVLAAVETAAGRLADVVVGKPEPPLYETALDRLGTRNVLAAGDRFDVDVAGARAAGLAAALVLSGATGAEEAAAADPAPDLVGATLADVVLSS